MNRAVLRAALDRIIRGAGDAIRAMDEDPEQLPAPVIAREMLVRPPPEHEVRAPVAATAVAYPDLPATPKPAAGRRKPIAAMPVRPDVYRTCRLAIIAHPGANVSRLTEHLGRRYPHKLVAEALDEMIDRSEVRREGRGSLARWYVDNASEQELAVTQPEALTAANCSTDAEVERAVCEYVNRAPGATAKGIMIAVLSGWRPDAAGRLLVALEGKEWLRSVEPTPSQARKGAVTRWYLGLEAPADLGRTDQ